MIINYKQAPELILLFRESRTRVEDREVEGDSIALVILRQIKRVDGVWMLHRRANGRKWTQTVAKGGDYPRCSAGGR